MVNITEYLEEMKKNWKTIITVVISFILLSVFFIKQQYEAGVKVFKSI